MHKRMSFIAGAIGIALMLALPPSAVSAAQPGTSVTGTIANSTLTVAGTNGNDVIALMLNPPSAIIVDVGLDGTIDLSFDRSNFDKIVVNGFAGNDTLIATNNGGLFTDTEATTLDGGTGNDDLRGAAGTETLVGGAGDDVADGNLGSDIVLLGTGNDTFQWDPGDSSDVIEGAGGVDTLTFNGSNIGELIEVGPNNGRTVLTRNIAAVVHDFDNIERVNIRTLGGSDVVTVHSLTGTNVKDVTVDLETFVPGGDGVPDDVVQRGTAKNEIVTVGAVNGEVSTTGLFPSAHVVGGEPTLDRFVVETLGGNDKVTAHPDAGATVRPVFDGGEGADTVTTNGTAGPDTLGIAPDNTAVAVFNATGVYDAYAEELKINGLGGADVITGMNGIGTRTHLTIDGGPGADDIRGGDGADTLLGGDGDDLVDGNLGADRAVLGIGNDTFEWDPGDGSDTVEGQVGVDTLAFNGSNAGEIIDLANQSGKLRLTRNIASITLVANDVEKVALRVLGSTDTVTLNDITATDVTDVAIDLGAFDGTGDLAADNVTVKGTSRNDIITVTGSNQTTRVTGLAASVRIDRAEAANDRLTIDGGPGADTVDPSGLAPDVIQLTIL